MEKPISIQEYVALTSDQEPGDLLGALSQLSTIENPEVVAELTAGPQNYWFGWN